MTKNISSTPEQIPANASNVLQQTLLSGFVFSVNLLMEQMVANQHALQQILTASTANAVAEITNPKGTDHANVIQKVDVVLKAIEESSTSYINLIRQLAVESEKALKMLNN